MHYAINDLPLFYCTFVTKLRVEGQDKERRSMSIKNRDSPIIYIGSRCLNVATARRYSALSLPGDPTPVAAAADCPSQQGRISARYIMMEDLYVRD